MVVKGWIGMPAFVAMAEHECGRRNRLADSAVIDKFSAGLKPAAHESIRRGANSQVPALGILHHHSAIRIIYGERLFYINVFSGFQGTQTNGGMGIWNGQIDHELNLWIIKYRPCSHRL